MRYKGFTLVEAMITMAIIGVLTVAAVSSWGPFMAKKKTYAAIEQLYSTLKLTRSESRANHRKLTIAFRIYNEDSNHWCYGISSSGNCDCRVSNNCLLDGNETTVDNLQRPSKLTISNLSGEDNNKYIEFEPVRGVASNSGSITVNNNGYSATIHLSALGMLNACSDQLPNYNACKS